MNLTDELTNNLNDIANGTANSVTVASILGGSLSTTTTRILTSTLALISQSGGAMTQRSRVNVTPFVIARYTKQPWSDTITLYPNIVPGIWQSTLTPTLWMTFQIVHTVLTVLSLMANCVSLIVVYGIIGRLTPHLQVLTSLAFADMLAPWAIMTMYFPTSSCQDEIHSALLLTSHNAASLSLLTLALCHNVATFRPLHYEKILTQRRLWIVINVIWITAILSAHVHFLAVLAHHEADKPYCIQVLMNTDMALTLSAAVTGATGLVSILIYARIMLHLRPIRLLADPESESRRSTAGVVTGIVLITTFLITWIPYLITKFVQVNDFLFDHKGILLGLATIQIVILLNTISNPVIYSMRTGSMQTGYLGLYHKCRGWMLRLWNSMSNKYKDMDDLPSTPLNPIESIC